jgi:hypothetical protein
MAHGRGDVNRAHVATTISPDYAVRSRDSKAFREYVEQEQQRKVTYSFRGEPNFTGADPSSIAAYLEYTEAKNR